MVVQPKRHDLIKLMVCVDYRWLNKATLTNPFPTPFVDKIIKEVVGHDYYSFTDDVLGYNEVPISKEDQHKIAFLCEFVSFAYRKMHFSIKNAPVVFSRIVV